MNLKVFEPQAVRDASREAAADPRAQLEQLATLAEKAAELGARGQGDAAARLRAALEQLSNRARSAEEELAAQEREHGRLHATVRALRAATRVTENVASVFQRERILSAIPDALTRSFGAATARVWLVGPGDRCKECPLAHRCSDRKSCLHLVPSPDLGALDLALQRVPIGDFSVGRVAALGGLVSSNDLDKDPGLADPDWARIERLRGFAGHPLVHEGRLLGVVAMWTREPMREEMLEALRILARHASTAIVGAQLIADVREQSEKSLQASRRLEALLDASRSGVIMFDHNGRATYVNGSFRRIFALSPQSPIVGHGLDEVEALLWPLKPNDADNPVLEERTVDSAHAEGDQTFQIQLPGVERPHMLRRYSALVQGPSGEALGWMDVFDDITHDYEVDRMKSEFISTVSHELRTPLTSIKGSLALLLEGEAQLEEEAHELVSVSKRNADRLVRLVNDILDISKLEADRLELSLQEVSAERVCRDAVSGIDGFAKRVGVGVKLELEPALPQLSADPDRVVQVLNNLLSNALKFSPRGSEVKLRVARAPEEGFLLFSVIDQGPGIPESFREKLFSRFAQNDRAKREQEGTGLGLAICRALVRIHGGEVWLDPQVTQGSTFHFTLRVASEPQQQEITT